MSKQKIKFLALGDSYTIGESVPEQSRWPELMKKMIESKAFGIETLKIIATTGWRTDELIQAIQKESLQKDWDLVSLCIGVNNQYQGRSIAQYVFEFGLLLDMAIDFCSKKEKGVFVFSIPDYAYTPFSDNLDKSKISYELDAYNLIAALYCKSKGVAFFDITPITREGLEDPELVATDGLHPSAKMYERWLQLYGADILKSLDGL